MSTHRKLFLKNEPFNLQIDSKKVGEALFDAVVHLADFRIGSFAKEVTQQSLENRDSLANIGFDLIFKSLKQATITAIDNYDPKFQNKVQNLATTNAGFNYDLTNQLNEAYLTDAIFQQPEQWKFLGDFQPFFEEWLQAVFNFTPSQAQSISRNIRFYFAEALYHEWDEHPNRYSAIKSYFEQNPFTEQLNRLREKFQYYARIKLNYQQPALGDPNMSLADIYIEPHFKVHKRNLPKNDNYQNEDRDGFFQLTAEDSLHDYVNRLLLQNKGSFDLRAEQSRMLLLLGQPGQGKSSFCHRLVHDLLEDANLSYQRDVIFVRLRDLPNPRAFVNHPFSYLQNEYEGIPSCMDWSKAIIILDGLDELYMSEGLTNDEINDFFGQLSREMRTKENCYLVLTSRYHYVRLEKVDNNAVLMLALDVLTEAQQKEWLRTYKSKHKECVLTEDLLTEINNAKDKDYEDIKELINQPILLHLIAKAQFDITDGKNKAEIYDRLFTTLIDRTWSEEGQLDKLKNLDKEEFRSYLRFIAHHIYQSDYEFILMNELLKLPQTKEFVEDNLNSDYEELEDALKDVLISFYFKPVDDQRLQAIGAKKKASAIEFFHKSLQEYLVVEHFWYELQDAYLEQDRRGKYRLRDSMEALKVVWDLSIPKGITQDMLPYLIGMIQNDEDLDKRQGLADRMSSFLTELLEVHFLYEYKADPKNPEPMKQAMRCFYVYWSVLSHLVDELNRDFSYFYYIKENMFDDFFHCLHMYKRFQHQAFFKVKLTNLENVKLEGSNFTNISLQGTVLRGANLARCNLYESDLKQVNLENANLHSANLYNTTLVRSNLFFTNFARTNLVKSNLSGSQIYGADFEDADLYNANLNKTYISKTSFRNANLDNIHLQDVYLAQSDISGAYIARAKLNNSTIDEIDFKNVNLFDVNLESTKLVNIKNLTYSQLTQTKTLYGCTGIPEDIERKLRETHPQLFEEPEEEG